MSLKSNLNQIIKDRHGEVYTLRELEQYCHNAGYKLSNAERRLRELRGELLTVYNEKHTAIIGYKYEEKANSTEIKEEIRPSIQPVHPATGQRDLLHLPDNKTVERTAGRPLLVEKFYEH